MRAAACHIVPLRAGGGTRIKILNAWAMGKAVVSTSVGCEGLDAVDNDNLLIRDEPAAFAEAVARVLADGALRRRLGSRGRQTVERRYSWDVMGRAMTSAYLDAARAWHASHALLESAGNYAHLSHTERHHTLA
jgi:glycosyltransferase involved in cell wall biosynthesis